MKYQIPLLAFCLALLVGSLHAQARFTTKDNILYAISLGWPADGTFRIKTLCSGNPHESRPIASVDFISGPGKIKWTQTNEALVIETDGNPPCEAAYAFRIKFADQ